MRLLLDTHVFLWWIAGGEELSRRARAAIADPAHECRLSLASVWEMAIKASLGKLRLPAPVARFVPEQLAANGFLALPIALAHAARVEQLAWHHRDPFDRLLAAQALEEDLALVTADPLFRRYGVRRVW
ncbi:MAG TPA: type II toxin-antitoxin system VapC family toxin [Thermoanaerobaculia bacterium]|nr:type II toxin-antitoxin system VapC family toxin [Thermoanaerobaculia bacterium]